MAHKVIYLRWGKRYTKDHVVRLEEQVKNNCSVPYEFVTINHCYAGEAYDRLDWAQRTYYRGKDDVEESVGNDVHWTPLHSSASSSTAFS